MSTKQLKRLVEQKESETKHEKSESEESEDEQPVLTKQANKFALLVDNESSEKDEEEDEKQTNPIKSEKIAKKKNKKKKNKKKQPKKNDDDLDEFFEETNPTPKTEIERLKELMKVTWPDLNPNNELSKKLGSGFRMPLDPQRKRGQRAVMQQYRIIQKDPNWPPIDGSGLSVVPDNEYPDLKPGYKYFKFQHNVGYQEKQQLFWNLMESAQPEINVILEMTNFHLDTILILVQQLFQHDDTREARKHVDFGIYICESVMPIGFEMLSPTHILSYEIRENRGFFLLLFWHLKFLIQRRCFFTAFQIAKLIFVKDPADPLAMALIIDSLAIKAEQYQFLLDFYEEFKTTHHLDGLLNFRYSVAIATHFLALEKDDPGLADIAKNQLYDALVFYPGILAAICENLQLKPTANVVKKLMIDEFNLSMTPKSLKLLEQIYIRHNLEDVWKKNGFMDWIETTTENLVNSKANEVSKKTTEARNMQKHVYVGMAEPVARHGNFFELYPAESGIPAVDPFPPLTTRAGYKKREKHPDQVENQLHRDPLNIVRLIQDIFTTLNPANLNQTENEEQAPAVPAADEPPEAD